MPTIHKLSNSCPTANCPCPSQISFNATPAPTDSEQTVNETLCCLLNSLKNNILYLDPFQPWVQLGADIDGEATLDLSGWSVSLSADGSRVAIGAIENDGGGADSGHTRIYEWNGASWVQLGADIDGEADSDLSGFSVSISADGTRVAIGAIFNDGGGNDSGHTRIYEWNGASWVQLGADIDGEADFDESGRSVSLSADGARVAIGAIENAGGGVSSGHTRIYEWDGSVWNQLGADIDGEANNDLSGFSVSLSADGSRVAIGAINNAGGGIARGHTRIYQWDGAAWGILGAGINGEANGDESGYSVSLSADGTRVAIGASYNDGGGTNSGHTRIYQWNSASWVQLGVDIDGEADFNFSGYSVSLSADGTRVAIGANGNDGGGTSRGHTRIYQWNGSAWAQLGADIDGEADGDQSGWSVSLSADGTRVAIGAYLNDGGGDDSGHTRIYERELSAQYKCIDTQLALLC